MTVRIARLALAGLLLGALVLGGCGGGGGGESPPTGPAPPAVAPPATVASAPTSPAAAPVITLSSDAGDPIGRGADYNYDTSNAAIRLTARGALLDVQVSGRESWRATFVLPGTAALLEPGTYGGLTRYPFQPVGSGAMEWSGEGRGCNTISGTLFIDSVRYEAGLLMALDLRFEQRCDGRSAALRGRIRVDAATMSTVTPPQNAQPAQPVITLTSDPGDYIGAGGRYAYDRATSAIEVRAEFGLLRVRVQGDEGWSGEFLMPDGRSALAPGTYRSLERFPFQAPGTGGFSWSGEGRGCNSLLATVTIHGVGYDSAGVLTTLDMSFVQHCEGGPAALRGRINWDASLPVPPPGPAASAPPGLWQAPEGAMPAAGNAMYLASDWDDYIGDGYTFRVGAGAGAPGTPGDTRGVVTVNISESGGLFRLGVTGAVNWSAEFKAMDGVTRLQPGYYGIVQRYPFHNPRRGGMNFSMDSRGCNRLVGWFMVDRVVYQGDRLTEIDLRFAQYCEAGLSALRGRIRWGTGGTTS